MSKEPTWTGKKSEKHGLDSEDAGGPKNCWEKVNRLAKEVTIFDQDRARNILGILTKHCN